MAAFINKTTRLGLLLCLGSAIGTAPHVMAPGGGQFWWNPTLNGGSGAHVMEHWPTIPAGGIPWRIHTMGGAIGPGLPHPTTTPGLAIAQLPGAQSMVAGAAAWNNVTIPGGVGSATTFRFSTAPTLWESPLTDPIIQDDENTVSLWLTDADWGGPMAAGGTALGIAMGYYETGGASHGRLDEFDIAINTTQTNVAGALHYNHLEDNTAAGITVATQGTTVPATSYCDLQGILTHEFGHAAGIGHSLVDSVHFTIPGLSVMHTPTMFPFAQTEFATDRTITELTPSGPPPALPTHFEGDTDFAATLTGGLMGSSARTLEVDDIAAIGERYPSPAFTGNLCTIKGRVMGPNGTHPVRGVHVTAIRDNDPDVTRVSTLTNHFGNYEIKGLPPGDYRVYIEGPDVTEYAIVGTARWKAGYFGPVFFINPFGVPIRTANPSLPQYVEQGWGINDPFNGAPISYVTTQFYTTLAGAHPSQADRLTVGLGAGQTQVLTLQDFKIWSGANSARSWDSFRVLPVPGPITQIPFQYDSGSGRGETIVQGTGPLTFQYWSTTALEVSVLVSRARKITEVDTGSMVKNMFQLDTHPAIFGAATFVSGGGGNPLYTFTYTPTPADQNQMLFFQLVEKRNLPNSSTVVYVPSGNVISVLVN